MDILILGGGGFIGSHLVDGLLRESEHCLCVYDLFADKLRHVQGHRDPVAGGVGFFGARPKKNA